MNKLPLLLTMLLAACGSTSPAEDMEMPEPDAGVGVPEEDTTAPTVFSMSPANGSIGVREDAVLVIEFSEPMDQLSVQNSLDTTDFAGIQFDWTNDSRTLTVTPDDPPQTETVTAWDSVATEDAPRRFLRLMLTLDAAGS